MSFEVEKFVSDCLAAVGQPNQEKVIRELLLRAFSDPDDVGQALGKPTRAGIHRLYVAAELTLLNVVWGPRMTLMPHNHNMWAIIGVYQGREDNIFWRRIEDDSSGRIEAAGAKSLGPGDVQPLGRNIIHSVTNPTSMLTGAVHVYGGDFFEMERSEWNPEDLREHPYDIEKNLSIFEDSNTALEVS
jgi:predicted metal-dependent enzyme (double-stranded beta helix superfamily)